LGIFKYYVILMVGALSGIFAASLWRVDPNEDGYENKGKPNEVKTSANGGVTVNADQNEIEILRMDETATLSNNAEQRQSKIVTDI